MNERRRTDDTTASHTSPPEILRRLHPDVLAIQRACWAARDERVKTHRNRFGRRCDDTDSGGALPVAEMELRKAEWGNGVVFERVCGEVVSRPELDA